MQVNTHDYVELKSEILDGMRCYMDDLRGDGADPGYAERDIDACEAIVDRYLEAARDAAGQPAQVRIALKTAVLALNALNARCGYTLIETEQREGLCDLLLGAAAEAGLGSGEEDLTEAWREW